MNPVALAFRAAALCAAALAVIVPAAVAAPPPNDSPSSPTPITTLPATLSGVTSEATMDSDEPAPLSADDLDDRSHGLDRSVWFSYMPDKDRNLLVDTCDANFTSHIDVYTGAPGALVLVATVSNDYRSCAGDRRSFAVKQGEGVLIRVTAERDGVRTPDGGVFHLSVVPQEPPANDAFAHAESLPGTGTATASLAFSTLELGEPSFETDTGSVWYRLVPGQSLPYTAGLPASPFDLTLAAFEAKGSTINRLRRLGSDFTESSVAAAVSFNALKGHVYYLRVGTGAKVSGKAELTVTTNTAKGIGLLVTPSENTLTGVRTNGFKAVLSCARTCRLGVDLLVSPSDAKRYGLVKGKKKPRHPVRVGHVGGTLQTGQPTSVTIPISSRRARSGLAHAGTVHFILRVGVRGIKGTKPVTKVIVVE